MPVTKLPLARSLLAVSAFLVAGSWSPREAGAEGLHEWFALPIEVTGLPPNADFVPVSCPIDFSAILARLKVSGAVDERSVRLLRVLADGRDQEEPVQFTPDPQPGSKTRRLLAGTTSQVSYLAEYPAGETPEVKVAGRLAWIAQSDGRGSQRYRLEFGVLRAGRMIQVPFPPQNLRAFDAEGRASPIRWFPHMQIRPQWPLDGVVHVTDHGSLVTSYHLGPGAVQAGAAPAVRRPFFYPVNGPGGVGLTDFGKPHDPTGSHAHHYSLWIAHASVGGRDFWSERGGIIAHRQLDLLEDGPVFCRLVQTTRWISQGAEVLSEGRALVVYAAARDFRLLDLDLEFSPAGSLPVELGKTTFGFLAVRVAQSMTPFDGGGEILNANGDRNEQAAHLKRARWLDQSGPIAAGIPGEGTGESVLPQGPSTRWGGIAIFDHPANVNSPTGWHCRNDGWACAAFNMSGPFTIPAGGTLRLRYRLLLHAHNAFDAGVARRYAHYASQPAVQVGDAARRP
jgi:hypothetical protein